MNHCFPWQQDNLVTMISLIQLTDKAIYNQKISNQPQKIVIFIPQKTQQFVNDENQINIISNPLQTNMWKKLLIGLSLFIDHSSQKHLHGTIVKLIKRQHRDEKRQNVECKRSKLRHPLIILL